MRSIFISVASSLISIVFIAACAADTASRSTNSANTANRSMVNAANGNSSIAATVTPASSANMSATTDTQFLRDAAAGGIAEVEMGKLASNKAADAEVKKFAQMMVTDHGKANDQLKELAAKKNIPLPLEIGSSHRATLDRLREAVGAEFDKRYVEAMVEDHEKDVKALEDKARNAEDPEIRSFAEKTLPVLRRHLESIRAIETKMK